MRFRYFQPGSLEEAISLLSEHRGTVKVMAGGTDLLVGIKLGKLSPPNIVGLARIPGLGHVSLDPSQRELRIGALATLNDVASSTAVHDRFGVLGEASSRVGSRQVRNLGTVVGNLCNASPSAETASSLLTLGASVNTVGPRGARQVALADFFVGPGKTVLEDGEIATELVVPVPAPGSAGAYLKLSPRKAMDLAVVGVAVFLTVRDGVCESARIALGAVAPTPVRVTAAEEILSGRNITDDLLQQAAGIAVETCRPISDVRGSAEYRREMVGVLVKRATKLALSRISK